MLAKKEADALRKRTVDTNAIVTDAQFDLGEHLYNTYYETVKDSEYGEIAVWSSWGYDSWEEYVEVELGLHWTTARKYRKVYEIFWVDLNGAWGVDELPESMTKMITLTQVPLTKKNLNGWLTKARSLSCCGLQALASGEETEWSNLNMRLTKSAATEVGSLLDKNKKTFNVTSRGEVLLKILREWKSIKRYLKKVNVKKKATV